MRRWFAVLIFLLTAHMAHAKDVYLVLAEPSGGLSLLGHSALIFAEAEASPINGSVYTYGIRGRNPLRFRADKFPGLVYFQQTTIVENRSILLLKLKLSAEESLKLEAKVEGDIAEGDKFAEHNTFNLFDSNCITYLLAILNEVTTQERHVNVQDKSSFWTTIVNGPWTFVDNIRFRAPVPAIVALENHAIADGIMRWMPRFEVRQAQSFVSRLEPTVDKLAECKGWQAQTKAAVRMTLALALKEQNKPLLQSVRKLQLRTSVCTDEEKLNTQLWTAAHDVLPMLATDLRDVLRTFVKEGGAK